jgi:hypothetical protein
MPAKTYHIILAYSTLVFEAEYLVRIKAIGDWAVSQAGLSGWNSKPWLNRGRKSNSTTLASLVLVAPAMRSSLFNRS